jgi:hypothetical protein
MYQTYGALAINSVKLRAIKPTIISLAGIGDVKCVPMSNIDIWSGAIIMCSWDKDPNNCNPNAMYLVDEEGYVHQFYGSVDVLMYDGVLYDLTAPYSNTLSVAEQVLMMVAPQHDAEQWWNEYIHQSIVMNLQGTDLVKHAFLLAEKYQWNSGITAKIKDIKIKPNVLSPIHKAKRLHYSVPVHERPTAQHID